MAYIFRVQAIMGHAQTVFNFPTLEAQMKLSVVSIDPYNGSLEASEENLWYKFFCVYLFLSLNTKF